MEIKFQNSEQATRFDTAMATGSSLQSSLLDMDYLAQEEAKRGVTENHVGSSSSYKMSWFKRLYEACTKNRGTFYKRLVDRNGHFKQSLGKMAIKKKIRREDWRAMYSGDLFHSLVDAPSSRTAVILLSLYFFIVVIMSIIYYLLSKTCGCNMGLETFQEAFAFSLETMATIGYGTPDIFFNGCWAPIIALCVQISCKLIAEAVIIGVIYCRFGRPTKRASTVIFSDKAILRRISGKLYFMFQLVELRKQQLVEAQVRLYTIRRDISSPTEEEYDEQGTEGESKESSNSTTTFQGGGSTGFPAGSVTHFQTCKMRLNFPNDELGGLLILCLPQMIVHEVDAWSPLMPPPIWRSLTDGKIHKWAPSFCKHTDHNTLPDQMGREKKDGVVDGYQPGYDQRYKAFCFPNVPGRSSAYTGNAGNKNTLSHTILPSNTLSNIPK